AAPIGLCGRLGFVGDRRDLAAAALFLRAGDAVRTEPTSPRVLVARGPWRVRVRRAVAVRHALGHAYCGRLALPAPALERKRDVRDLRLARRERLPALLP